MRSRALRGESSRDRLEKRRSRDKPTRNSKGTIERVSDSEQNIRKTSHERGERHGKVRR